MAPAPHRRARLLLGALLLGGIGVVGWVLRTSGSGAGEGAGAGGAAERPDAAGAAAPVGERGEQAAAAAPLVAAEEGAEDAAEDATEAATSTADAEEAGRRVAPATRFDDPIEVEGSVHDADGGAPVARAIVALAQGRLRVETRTDDAGLFTLEWGRDVPADLEVGHPGYVDVGVPDVALDAPIALTLQRSATIVGHVRGARGLTAGGDGDGEGAEAHAHASAWRQTASSKRFWVALEAPLDENGAFRFEDLAPGDYALTATVPGYTVPVVSGVHVESGEERTLDLDLAPGATVEGHVVEDDEVRIGVEGVRLTLTPAKDDLPREARSERGGDCASDGDGSFRFEDVAPGTYRLEVALPWGERLGRDVDVDGSGQEVEVEIAARPPGSIAGVVVDASGDPVADARLAVFPRDDGWRWQMVSDGSFDDAVPRTRTDHDGAFRFERVPAGRPLAVSLQRATGAGAGAAVPIPLDALRPGEERTDVRLELPPEVAVEGRVLDPDGNPLAGGQVELYANLAALGMKSRRGARLGLTHADAEGAYRFLGIAPGRVTLFAHLAGYLGRREETEVGDGGATVDLVLQPMLAVVGHARDEDGHAIAGLPVRAQVAKGAAVDPDDAYRGRARVAETDALGRFRIEGLYDTTWVVSGGSFEWELVRAEPAEVRPQDDREVALTFEPRDRPERFSIHGRVEDGQGLPPAGMRLVGLAGGVVEIDSGRFHVTGLTPTRQRFSIRAEGLRSLSVGPIDPTPGQEVDLGLLVMEPAVRVVVRVTGPKGARPGKVRVLLVPVSPEEGGPADGARVVLKQGRDGRFRTDEAARSVYRLLVRRDGIKPWSAKVDLRDRKSYTRTVRL